MIVTGYQRKDCNYTMIDTTDGDYRTDRKKLYELVISMINCKSELFPKFKEEVSYYLRRSVGKTEIVSDKKASFIQISIFNRDGGFLFARAYHCNTYNKDKFLDFFKIAVRETKAREKLEGVKHRKRKQK